MSQTVSQKILAEHAGLKSVEPGEIVKAKIDIAMAPDLTAVLAYNAMKEMGVKRVWDKSKVVFMNDHIAPATNVQNATLHKQCREIARDEGFTFFYDINAGVCHQVLPERGHVWPGMVLVGADSHTCTHGAFGAFATGVGSTDMGAALATGKLWFKVPETIRVEVNGALPEWVAPKDVVLKTAKEIGADGATYMAIEFGGETIRSMSMAGRMTLCNMAIEMGGKTGIVEPDRVTDAFLKRPRQEQVQDNKVRPRRRVREEARHRRLRTGAAGRLSSCRRQRQISHRGRWDQGRPGLHRLLHKRAPRGPGRGREDTQGEADQQGRSPHGDALQLRGI